MLVCAAATEETSTFLLGSVPPAVWVLFFSRKLQQPAAHAAAGHQTGTCDDAALQCDVVMSGGLAAGRSSYHDNGRIDLRPPGSTNGEHCDRIAVLRSFFERKTKLADNKISGCTLPPSCVRNCICPSIIRTHLQRSKAHAQPFAPFDSQSRRQVLFLYSLGAGCVHGCQVRT